MTPTKQGLLGELVAYINTLDKGTKTIAYMTAILFSWEKIDIPELEVIVEMTKQALMAYEKRNLTDFDKIFH